MRLQILFLLLFFINSINLAADSNYKISGEINYNQNRGRIYIKLFTKKEFNEKNEPNKMPVIQPQHRHIRYNDAGPSFLILNH